MRRALRAAGLVALGYGWCRWVHDPEIAQALRDDRSPREVMEDVNAYHAWPIDERNYFVDRPLEVAARDRCGVTVGGFACDLALGHGGRHQLRPAPGLRPLPGL